MCFEKLTFLNPRYTLNKRSLDKIINTLRNNTRMLLQTNEQIRMKTIAVIAEVKKLINQVKVRVSASLLLAISGFS